MSGFVGDKQWEEYMRLKEAYLDKFGEIDFTTMDMDTDEIIATFKEALASGEPVRDNIPEGIFL